MNAALLLVVGCVILIVGYVTYGKWLAQQWGIDENRVTPAHELEDGNDYVPAKAPVLMGHHFPLSQGQVLSTDQFRQPYLAGYLFFCGY